MNKLECSIQKMLSALIFLGLGTGVLAQPAINSFSPASGSIGTLITISGTDLSDPTSFTIGGVAAIVISNDGTTLVGMVMPGATTGNISITTGGGTVNSNDDFTVIPNSLLPTAQQGSKLVGSGYIGSSIYQGASVSLSADGNTALIGGYYDNSGIGAAWIYTRIGNTWTQQGSKLVGTGYSGTSFQGVSVFLSADGNTAMVGGQNDNSGIGAVWIYTRTGSTWTQQGSKLVGAGNTGTSSQGHSVSISADGNTAIVGGFQDNSNIGAVWIFTRSGNTWTQQGNKLVGTGFTGTSNQGVSVSLSADGNTAIVGGYRDNGDIGAAWIYTRSGSTWTQQGNKLVGTGYTGTPYQGYSVSLSADGNTTIVGGYADNSNIGAAWIFTRSGETWTQQGSKLVGAGAAGTPRQGISVSLTADGNTAMIGGYTDNSNIGASWLYSRTGSTWTQQGSKLVGTGYTGTPYQGLQVCLSAEGNTALIGGHYDNSGIGAVWAFVTLPLAPLATAATTINATGFTASWNISTGATGYRLDVDDNNDFSSPVVNDLDVANITTKTVTGLTPSTTYYYRVRAYNTNGTSENSNIITLTTLQTQTITFEALNNKIYGDIPFNISATGGASGNPVTFTSSDVTVVTCTGTNGVTVTILKSGSCSIYANQAGNESYDAAPQVEQTLLIDQKNLTISGISISNKIYDANTTATITGVPALDGIVGTDNVDLVNTGASALFDTKDAGTVKAVTITGYSLSGSDIGNYELTQPIGLTADISKATPVITWSDPADIIENTALSTTQLNATADVPGTFLYTPSAGTILDIGNNQPLQVAFTPDDDTNYNSTSETVYINVSTATSIGDIIKEGEINLYPNPVKNELIIDIGRSESVIDVLICDLSGKVVMIKTKISSPATIDMSEVVSGLYIIHIETDKRIKTSRIVKE